MFTWGDTPKECYQTTIDTINTAISWLETRTAGQPPFGGPAFDVLAPAERTEIASALMVRIRGMISADNHKIGHFDDSDAVLEFVCSKDLAPLAALGTSCPDHFLRTKICPLLVELTPGETDVAAIVDGLTSTIAAYRENYADYYNSCRHANSPAMRDPNPVIFLVPGVGMISFAKDKATARISSEFYINAINVMRGAAMVSTYQGLPTQEAFDIEYWLLEEAKLQRQPKAKSLAGKVAFVTGGAGGIGRATAIRMLREGACVVLADIDVAALKQAEQEMSAEFGSDAVRSVVMNVVDEAQVDAAYQAVTLFYGGIDILVSNAGLASSAPIEETSLALWDKNISTLTTGYFLVSRAAFKLFRAQGIGGSVVFVASKKRSCGFAKRSGVLYR